MLVITAPTGQIGRQVLEKVLEGDRPIRVIARDPGKLPVEGGARHAYHREQRISLAHARP